jgi:ElaB/YqjD/DUF883 family membrane-anchored ribosome-binding protein
MSVRKAAAEPRKPELMHLIHSPLFYLPQGIDPLSSKYRSPAQSGKGNWHMNVRNFEKKVKKDFDVAFERLEQSTVKVKNQISTWTEDGTTQLSDTFNELKGDTLDKLFVVTKSFEQDIDQGLNKYNSKVQQLADQVPGGFSRKTARYPWVTISVFLASGLLLGLLLKPSQRSLRSLRI